MKDQFRSDERIANVTAPVLILHGLNDRVVPYAMGEQMFDLAKGNKHIVRFIDGGHEDLDQYGALHAVGRFSPEISISRRRRRQSIELLRVIAVMSSSTWPLMSSK
jgi:fermentation-respiration switch protein FrsA (DUF1100 family)